MKYKVDEKVRDNSIVLLNTIKLLEMQLLDAKYKLREIYDERIVDTQAFYSKDDFFYYLCGTECEDSPIGLCVYPDKPVLPCVYCGRPEEEED
jgi:hypothetical protein